MYSVYHHASCVRLFVAPEKYATIINKPRSAAQVSKARYTIDVDTQMITQQTLEDAGIDLTGEDILALLAHLNDIVEERISTKITDTLSEEQMKAMLSLQDNGDDQDLAVWMKKHVPKMDTLVQAEVDRLIDEIIDTDDEE